MASRAVRTQRDRGPSTTSDRVRSPGGLQLHLDAEQQQHAVEIVLSDFARAEADRAQLQLPADAKGVTPDYETWMAELRDLYFGHRKPKTLPWRYCANRSMMLAMAIVDTLWARFFPAIWNEDLTRWRPGEVSDVERVERVSRLMRWWTSVHAPLRETMESWLLMAIAYGTVWSETVWDIEYRDVPEPPGVDTPGTGGVAVEVIERTRTDLITPEDVFTLAGTSDPQRETVIFRRQYRFRQLEDMERAEQAVNIHVPTVPGGQTVAEALLQDVLREQDRQADPLTQLERETALRNRPVTVLTWYGRLDLDRDGWPEDVKLTIVPSYRLYVGGVRIRDLSPRGLRHIDATSFMARLDDPQGVRGLGILEKVRELVLEIDAIVNQLTDANTLSVLRPFFYEPAGDVSPQAMTLGPNKAIPVSNPTQNVYFPDLRIPIEPLLHAVRLVLEFVERVTGASAYILGKESEIVGGSGTATRVERIVQSANQRHALPMERLRQGAARVLTQHFDLVQQHLPPGLEQRVLGVNDVAIFKEEELTQEGLAGRFDAYLLPDESLGSKDLQRQLAEHLYSILMQNLLVMGDPARIYKVTADVLTAWGRDPESYLGPAPDLNSARSAEDEHTLLLQGDMAQVRVTLDQNHLDHLLQHEAFTRDPAFLALPEADRVRITEFLDGHRLQHQQLFQNLLAVQASLGGTRGSNGRTASAPAVGPEPRVGGAESPLSRLANAQRTGESQPAPARAGG